jgi:adenylate cyclase
MAQSPNFTANLRILAASLAAAGKGEEAHRIGGQLTELEPGFRVGPFCEQYAYRDTGRRTLMAEHLRAAGLPG